MDQIAMFIRNLLAKAVAFIDRSNADEEERRKELLAPPGSTYAVEKLPPPGSPKVAAAPPSKGATDPVADLPMPPASPPPPASAATGVAGLRERQKGGLSRTPAVEINKRDDTTYIRRDAVVAKVEEKYGHLPPSVSAALLARLLLPNGLEMLLERIGAESAGSEDGNHRRLLAHIEEHGLESFCLRVGIRYDPGSPSARRPSTAGRPSDSAGPRDTNGARPAPRQRPTTPPSEGASARMRLAKVNVKPVDLNKRATDQSDD